MSIQIGSNPSTFTSSVGIDEAFWYCQRVTDSRGMQVTREAVDKNAVGACYKADLKLMKDVRLQ